MAARQGRLSQWKLCHPLTHLPIGFPNPVARYALTNSDELEGLSLLDLAQESFDHFLLDECSEFDRETVDLHDFVFENVDLHELYRLYLVPDGLESLQLDDFGQHDLLDEGIEIDSDNPHESRYLRHGLLNFLSF